MASRCRSCHLSVPCSRVKPNPEQLLPLIPHIGTLFDAAAEFESFGEGESAIEFLRWLEVDLRRLAARP